jgi:hypothetical protein
MKEEPTGYTGTYYFFGVAFDVRIGPDGLEAAMSGVPEGYEIPLEHIEGRVYRMRGGPLGGAPLEFIPAEDGSFGTVRAGGFELKRIAPDALGELDLVDRSEAPPFELTTEKERAFSELYVSEIVPAEGRRIDYRLPYPKHEFIRYLMETDRYIFHGSGNRNIEQFEPVRTSVELYDSEERGNLPAVYGTHDGLWAMFFAVIDRGRLDGSIRNGVLYFHNRAGDRLALYNFSINKDNLPDRPYHTGALYLLPRTTFIRQKLGGGAPANEWASLSPVRPTASLLIDPDDFPFLDRIGGHDDGPLVRAQTLQKRLMEAVVAAETPAPDSRRLVFRPEGGLAEDAAEFIELQGQIMPGVEYIFEPGNQPALEIRTMPPAMVHVLDANLKERGLA